METIIIASLRDGVGKTSTIVGLAGALGKKFGYLKPFGERVLYRKKRLLDYDSALVKNLFDLDEDPEDMSIGFDHSKLRYMYNESTIIEKLREMRSGLVDDKEILLIEAGKDLMYGSSVNLDAFSLTRSLEGRLIIIVSGDDDTIIDDLTFIKNHVSMGEINFAGVVINKIKDVEDFRDTYMEKIDELGIEVLGMIPFQKDLTYLSIGYISDVLFAKVLAGERNFKNQVKEIYIGAMSGDAALKNPLFSKENKLIITSGDREDMCLAALESETAGIILTNNILPSSNIINQAENRGIPLLLVPGDTFHTAKQVDDMERLITRDDSEKVELLKEMIKENVNLEAF
jgi:hypothetical protein